MKTLTLLALIAAGSLLASVELEETRECVSSDSELYNQTPITSSVGWLIKWGLIGSAALGMINENCIVAAPAQGVGCLSIALVVAVLSRVLHNKHLPDKIPPAMLPRLCSGTMLLFCMPVWLPYVMDMFVHSPFDKNAIFPILNSNIAR